MKNILRVALSLVAAVVIGGGSGYYAVEELVMHRPQWAVESMVRMRAADGAVGNAAKSEKIAKRDRDGVRVGRETNWITEPKHGPYKCRPYQVADIRKDGAVVAKAIDPCAARQGIRTTLERSLRKWGKAPKEERDSWLRRYTGGRPNEAKASRYTSWTSSKEHEGPVIYPGDVFLDGIPMIDQGQAPFCAVASAARVLQSYGIDVTMEDMAELANSSETAGTNVTQWEKALREVANAHGLDLQTIKELTNTSHPLSSLVDEYNSWAGEMGCGSLVADDYLISAGSLRIWNFTAFEQDQEYAVRRQLMLMDDARREAFTDNVIGRISESDPLFWCVNMGNVPEEVPHLNFTALSANRGEHMRLIIGYNEERGEVLYSDSWGEGHELKRMDGLDALSITTGMYYLTDKPQASSQ